MVKVKSNEFAGVITGVLLAAANVSTDAQQSNRARLDQIEQSLKARRVHGDLSRA
jgi:hypothetical protein